MPDTVAAYLIKTSIEEKHSEWKQKEPSETFGLKYMHISIPKETFNLRICCI